jgi:hypothetical protein
MNEKVKAYIEKAEKDRKMKEQVEKEELLISLGLYETVYSDTHQPGFTGYDRKTKKYYRLVPLEVSDEEYATILELNPETAEPAKPSFWIIGTRIFAWIAFFSILIYGFILSYRYGEAGDLGTGLLISVGAILAAFLSASGIMIFTEMVQNIADIEQLIIYKIFKR